MSRTGAPSKFSDDKEAAVIAAIAEGGTLADAAAAADVDRSTVKRWLAADDREEFRAQYVQARQDQADAFADKILDIARNDKRDPSCRRVEIDALKWLAGKRKPKVYSDKTEHEHSGPGGGAIPILNEIKFTFVKPGDV